MNCCKRKQTQPLRQKLALVSIQKSSNCVRLTTITDLTLEVEVTGLIICEGTKYRMGYIQSTIVDMNHKGQQDGNKLAKVQVTIIPIFTVFLLTNSRHMSSKNCVLMSSKT